MTSPPLPPPAHTAPLPPARTGPDNVRVLGGVAYAALPGVRPLELDLYLPPGESSSVPAVVFLHGGGWRLGSRRLAGPAYVGRSPSPFERLAAGGIAVASIDYRLSGEARWPSQLHDAKAAVRWLRSRADELGVDPDRIAAWGESSGGHLAALLGLTGRELDGEIGVVGPSSAVAAVVAWYPPTDLASLPGDLGSHPMAVDSREALLLGAPLPTVPELTAEASPLTHVRPGAPPFLLLHGEADQLIPCVQSERLVSALRAVDGDVEFETFPGADHMWRGSPDVAEAALDLTERFLRQRLIR